MIIFLLTCVDQEKKDWVTAIEVKLCCALALG